MRAPTLNGVPVGLIVVRSRAATCCPPPRNRTAVRSMGAVQSRRSPRTQHTSPRRNHKNPLHPRRVWGRRRRSSSERHSATQRGSRRNAFEAAARREKTMATATAPAALQEAHRRLKRRYGLLIDGEWVEPASGSTFKTLNPATGEPLAEIAAGEAADIDRAVTAARRAFESGPWRRVTPAERQRMIWRLADLIERSLEEF